MPCWDVRSWRLPPRLARTASRKRWPSPAVTASGVITNEERKCSRGREGGQGHGGFHDLDELTIFADNLVPHVLRMDRVLAYDAALAERVDREELILAGSMEEVEIRACAVHAVELIVAQLRQAGVIA